MSTPHRFFITGLPRSRTSWLSAWLTVAPVFCYHDACANGPTVDALEKTLVCPEGYTTVGDSDSGLLACAAKVHRRWPEAPWLFVHRPAHQCFNSFKRRFADDPYPGAPLTEQGLETVFLAAEQCYRAGLLAIPGGLRMEVEFDDLNDFEVLARVHEFLVPGVPADSARLSLLDTLRIDVMTRKTEVLPWQSSQA